HGLIDATKGAAPRTVEGRLVTDGGGGLRVCGHRRRPHRGGRGVVQVGDGATLECSGHDVGKDTPGCAGPRHRRGAGVRTVMRERTHLRALTASVSCGATLNRSPTMP